jgi:AGCS family alanine or glycine:cation symporter
MLGWSYYGEKGLQYLLGEWSVYPYRILWVAVIPIGAVVELEFVWTLAETLSAFMIVPNVIGLALLSRHVFKWTALAEHA